MQDITEMTDDEASEAIGNLTGEIIDMILDKYRDTMSPVNVTLATFFASKRMIEALGSQSLAAHFAHTLQGLAIDMSLGREESEED